MKRKFNIFTLIFFFFSLVACGKNDKKGDVAETKTAPEQVFTLTLGAEPDSLDMAKSSDAYTGTIVCQVLEGLVSVELDKSGERVIVPAIAESWERSDDGLQWTFKIRDKAVWEDGEPLRAQDYEYSMKRVIDPETASPVASLLYHIKNAEKANAGEVKMDEVGIESLDDKTIRFTLEYPVPYFLDLMTGRETRPLRQDYVEKLGASHGTEADKLLSCGPFKLDSWVHNSEIVLVKNPNYWDADAVKLEKVVFKIVQDSTALMGEFMNGNVDLVAGQTAEWIETLEAENKYKRIIKLIPRTHYFFINQGKAPFKSVKCRQALSVAINRKEISEVINQGLTVTAYGWLPPPIELNGKSFRTTVGDPLKELITAHPDPKALFIEGLKEQGLGDDPSKITIQLMYAEGESKEYVEYLQQDFQEKLGVKIELDPDEWPVFQERNRQLDYVIGFKSWGAGYNDPLSFLALWKTGNKIVPINWSNPKYDKLVDEASLSIDPDVRLKNYREAERILLLEDCAIAPYAYSTADFFIQPNVKGLMLPDFASGVLKYVYIE